MKGFAIGKQQKLADAHNSFAKLDFNQLFFSLIFVYIFFYSKGQRIEIVE
jgi:hypothetical protein